MAYLVAFGHRERVRGVAVVDAPLPRGNSLPDNDPIERLDYYSGFFAKSPQAARMKAGVDQLQKLKLPVVAKDLGEPVQDVQGDALGELGRWIDCLDRI